MHELFNSLKLMLHKSILYLWKSWYTTLLDSNYNSIAFTDADLESIITSHGIKILSNEKVNIRVI